jgi:hypothetical protein
MKFIGLVLLLLMVMLTMTACTPEGKLLPELQEPLSYFLQQLIQILVIPLLIMGLSWLAAKAKGAWDNFKIKNPTSAYWIDYVIRRVVLAAEQMNEKHPELVKNKKQWALGQANAMLLEKGIALDIDELSTLIEAEVKSLFNWDYTPEPPPEGAE